MLFKIDINVKTFKPLSLYSVNKINNWLILNKNINIAKIIFAVSYMHAGSPVYFCTRIRIWMAFLV